MKRFVPTPESYRLVHEGSLALAVAEHNGIRVDQDYVERTIVETNARIGRLEEKLKADEVFSIWRRRFGQKTTIGSRDQLAEVIFVEMKHPCREWTAGGATKKRRPKAKEESFSEVKLPFVKRYFRWTKLKDLKTRLTVLRRELVDGYLHANFNLHLARTFRSSSGSNKDSDAGSEFNFHNIPVRDPKIARKIREAFVPRPGRYLVENDFSALEFKGAGLFWKDPALIEYASDPDKDIHRDMAAACYKCRRDQVSKMMRYCGKNGFVFPKLYGSYYKQIARNMWGMIDQHDLNVDGQSLKEWLAEQGIHELGDCDPTQKDVRPGTFEYHIREVERKFEKRFHVFNESKEKWYDDYRRNGGFMTLTGFPITGLYSKNGTLNYPIQSICFHFCLKTIVLLQRWLRKNKMKSLIVGQIHDCIVGDVVKEELQDYLNEVKRIVEVELPAYWKWICVPLAIEAEVSDTNWYAKKQWEQHNGVWAPKQEKLAA